MEARKQSSSGGNADGGFYAPPNNMMPQNPGGAGGGIPQNQSDQRRGPQPNVFDKANRTEEENRVLRECEAESFYYRALPASIGAMIGAKYMVQTGRWAAHPKLGALPKTFGFATLGFFIGKLSYISTCRQKILDQIPNSNLAIAMKKAAGNKQSKESDDVQWESQPARKQQEDYNAFSQATSPHSESTTPAGLDDRFRPTVDKDSTNENMPEDGQKKTTYEELRRRNRQQYEESKAKQPPKPPGSPSYKDSPLMPQKPWPDARTKPSSPDGDLESSDPMPSPPPSQGAPKRKRTNMWGDVIED